MSSAVKILPHYTYNDWVNWKGQWELIDGIPHAMSPMPLPKHQRIGSNLIIEFGNELKKCKRCNVYQPLDYKISEEVILQPDMLIVCGNIDKNFLDFSPVLVTEILSPSTALKDRHTKFDIYERQLIQFYLIVSPENEQVEIYEIEDSAYRLRQSGREFTHTFTLDDCTATVDFKAIW